MAVTNWAPVGELKPAPGPSAIAVILSRRERIPAYQATGVSGSGDEVEVSVGQIWPR